MRKIRRLKQEELHDALLLSAKAYPILELERKTNLEAMVARLNKDYKDSPREWYGLFEDDVLLGSMILYDYTLRFYGKDIKARGIGFVAVDFLHKKQGICRQMLDWALKDSTARSYQLFLLYSFRPDFYHCMGLGYIGFCHNYQCAPQSFPKQDKAYQMRYLEDSEEDLDAVVHFYEELYRANHGMIRKRRQDLQAMLRAESIYKVANFQEGEIHSLLIFKLRSGIDINDTTEMTLELLFSSQEGLRAALSFLNGQSDQVSTIKISTPYSELFYALTDIRHQDHKILHEPGFHHVYDTGMGLMGRALAPAKLICSHPAHLEDIRIRFVLKDPFAKDSDSDFIIEWKDGRSRPGRGKKHDLMMTMDLADFSSWIMNAVDLESLYRMDRLSMSKPEMLRTLSHAFCYGPRPICLEKF